MNSLRRGNYLQKMPEYTRICDIIYEGLSVFDFGKRNEIDLIHDWSSFTSVNSRISGRDYDDMNVTFWRNAVKFVFFVNIYLSKDRG
ncbi:hypothetical protein RIR_jg24815.t1 [Rhizophagus irregularis DAOM 181602=DAOM 197198]|nr:hypothetical protein RIR_jg24815.t1 [Rhizophagus irregularis DAOM 181602=DAOM 197198]